MRQRGETQSQLAHDVEELVRRAYPTAALLRGLRRGWTPLQRLTQPEGSSVSGKRLQAEGRGRLSAGQNSSAPACVKPDSPQQLCGVTGDYMSLQGPVNARVRVGGVEEDMSVFVADLDEECLLGYDYLTRMDAFVDFRQKRMTVRGHDVPFLREVRRAEVVTTKQLRLPPRTEARVQCRLTRVMKDAEGLVSDLRLADGVALGRSLVGAGGGVSHCVTG
ncbi:hypothetical protein E2C01_097233 [Portunus trituberculatus]|uniref:Uncharacterized protein n=1 Tax=Portunus trituberculatus TaxID=210409 RepID=A0A5B7JZX3_PORTR|nr:hypothetical protein [Portunus trituberculatus]